MWVLVLLLAAWAGTAGKRAELLQARDRQDRAALERLIAELGQAAQRLTSDARVHYELALAQSYLAEVLLEQQLRAEARVAAENGIRAAERAVALKPDNAEYHRVLGTLCGQVIPANVLAGLKYGKCAMESINKALELDPKSAQAWLSRGVGNYYLPKSFGGGVDLAIRDMRKALELDPRSADALLWLALAYRRNNQIALARKSLEESLKINPHRVWAKHLLEKLPN